MSRELTAHDLKEEAELARSLASEDKSYLIKEIIEKNRRLDELEREVCELSDFDKWYYILEDRIRRAVDVLSNGVTYCENDSQLMHKTCVSTILRERKVIDILKGEDENGDKDN